jgi:hypothetical protein
VIPVPEKLNWEDHKFKAILGCIARYCLKKEKIRKRRDNKT